MNCPVCGKEHEENLSFCPDCGSPYTARDKAFTTAASPNKLTKPLKTKTFFWLEVLKEIPIVNLIVFLVWAFSSDINLNKKNYARAQLIWYLVEIAIIIIAVFVSPSGRNLFESLLYTY